MNINYIPLIFGIVILIYTAYAFYSGKIVTSGEGGTDVDYKMGGKFSWHGFYGEVLTNIILSIFFFILFYLLQHNIIYYK